MACQPSSDSCDFVARFLVPGWRLGWIQIHDRNDALKEVCTYEPLFTIIWQALPCSFQTVEKNKRMHYRMHLLDTLENDCQTDKLVRALKYDFLKDGWIEARLNSAVLHSCKYNMWNENAMLFKT